MLRPHPAARDAFESPRNAPRGDAVGFAKHLRHDVAAGFMVALIALPLCLGIALACGFPPVAGVLAAVIGAVVTTVLSNSELTIKGPAAGMIVIVLGAMESFGATRGVDVAADIRAYRMTLAVGCVAGVVQLVVAALRSGAISEFFPTAVVHGMLAAIGLIIFLKQLPVVFGEPVGGEPLEVLRNLPAEILGVNPQIAVIGVLSLVVLFGWPVMSARLRPAWLRLVPAPLLVLAVAVPLGMWFDLSHEHTYSFLGHDYRVGESFLVTVPGNLLAAMTTPDFSVFTDPATRSTAAWWVLMFTLVGSIESLLSARAIDLLDPWHRKTDMNRDLAAVGVANVVVAAVGGLPLISEIVRSKANIDAGGRTRFADLWHGVFLLGFVGLAPQLIHRIPLAALAAMLVYTGFRLASPREFVNVFKIGSEQLFIFVATIVAVLATDLLVGAVIGVLLKAVIHAVNGVPLTSFFKPFLEVTPLGDDAVQIDASGSAVFTNWIPFRRQIEQLGLVQRNNVVVNLAGTTLVDHSVMEKLDELAADFTQAGLTLEVVGLDAHRQASAHRHASRRRVMTRLRRVTVVADADLESGIVSRMRGLGSSGHTVMPCHGAGRRGTESDGLVRIEAIVTDRIATAIIEALRVEYPPPHRLTVCLETVEVLQPEAFAPLSRTEP
jgi:MFS superfamily sulfate permease-like transporter